jgi:hypothetical protein
LIKVRRSRWLPFDASSRFSVVIDWVLLDFLNRLIC